MAKQLRPDGNKVFLVAKSAPTLRRKHASDVYFIWLVLMFISVVAAHFTLNVSGDIPTGYVAAAQNPAENLTLLLSAMIVAVTIAIAVGVGAASITKDDYEFYR